MVYQRFEYLKDGSTYYGHETISPEKILKKCERMVGKPFVQWPSDWYFKVYFSMQMANGYNTQKKSIIILKI